MVAIPGRLARIVGRDGVSGNWAKLRADFDSHPKVVGVSLAAIGLWCLCNSRSRRKRTAGYVDPEWVTEYKAEAEAAELVEAGLWHKEGEGYRYHAWSEHNADEHPKSTAARLVAMVIPAGHPQDVMAKLAAEVSDLLIEGIEFDVVKMALKLWLGKTNAPPSWLPMLVSDVVRRGGFAERDAALRDAWRSGDLKPLARFGLVFTPPDLPREVKTVDEAKSFMSAAKRAWITEVRERMT